MLSALDLITFMLRPSNLLSVLSVSALGGLPSRGVQWLLNTFFSFDAHGVLFVAVSQIKWYMLLRRWIQNVIFVELNWQNKKLVLDGQ